MTSAFAARMLSPTLEVFDGSGAYRYENPAHAGRARRATSGVFDEIGKRYKGLVSEHMAHYHHMAKVAPNAWQHGHVHGQWAGEKRLVTERNAPETPSELVPEHLGRVNQSGVDGIWSLGGNTFHFVEAKFNESAGAMFGRGHSYTQPRKDKKTGEVIKEASKLAPPPGLTERQLALWHMLGQPKKGLQMGRPWLKATVAREMGTDANIANRWVYAFFAVPSNSPPKDYAPKSGGPLKKHVAGGSGEHVMVSGEVAERFLTGGDIYDLTLHDRHKPTHEVSDEFSADELNTLERHYVSAVESALLKPKPAAQSATRKKGIPSK